MPLAFADSIRIEEGFQRLLDHPDTLMVKPGDQPAFDRVRLAVLAPEDLAAILPLADRVRGHCTLRLDAQALLLAGNVAEAVSGFALLVESSPEVETCYRDLGLAAWMAGQEDEAVQALERACALAPKNALPWRWLGCLQFARGEIGKAEEAYLQALALAPQWPEARRNLARTYLDQGKLDEAIETYRSLITEGAVSAELYRNLGVALLSRRRFTAAVQAFQDGIRIDPNLASIWRNLGQALMHQRQWLAAGEAFRRSLAVTDHPVSRIGLWAALQQLGHPSAAAAFEDFRAAAFREASWRRSSSEARSDANGGLVLLKPISFIEFFGEAAETETLDQGSASDVDAILHGASSIAFDSLLWDRAWRRRDLTIVRAVAFDVVLHESTATPHFVNETGYICERPYHIPARSRYTHTHSPLAEDADYRPFWLIDLTGMTETVVEEPCVYLGGSPNYGHFLIDTLPKLVALDRLGVDPSLPVYHYGGNAFQRRLLELFFPGRRILDMRSFGADVFFRFRQATVLDETSYAFAVGALRALADQYLPDMGASFPDKVYLSRRNYPYPSNRVVNDAEIAAHLEKRGFVTLAPELLSFTDTVTLFRHAGTVVTCTGAQNGNIPFLPPGARYVELSARHHASLSEIWLPYACLASYVAADYRRLLGEDVYRARSMVPGWACRYDLEALDVVLDA